MRYKTIVLLLLLVIIGVRTQAQNPPWNEKGELVLINAADGKYRFGTPDPWVIADSFKNRFGTIPNIIVYEDIQAYYGVRSTFEFDYRPYYDYQAMPEDSVWWQENFTWGQLRPHLQAVLENTATGVQQILPLPNYDLDRNIAYLDTGTYAASFTTNIEQIPITQSNVEYKLWVEPLTLPLPTYLHIDTLSIVKTTRSVPEDTLLWMYRNWESSITQDPALPARMLEFFPDDTRMLRHQFWMYYQAINCDSVIYYGDRLIAVWESGESRYFGDLLGTFNSSDAVEDVQDRIKHICVSGTPQPITRLGGSEL